MLAVQGNDAKDEQIPPAYEKSYSPIQSKKIGIRRIRFQDTDDNAADTQAADYSAANVSGILPRCVADGEWGKIDLTIVDIQDSLNTIPKFYATYCTEESQAELIAVIEAINTELAQETHTLENLTDLKSQLEAAKLKLVFKSDEKVPQIYIATDKGNGESYGTTLTKAIGYVSAQITCVDAGGKVITSDLSWASNIKVRGNATAGGAKKPYNMKFSSKVNLFDFGEAKKWVLLADYYDRSIVKNKIALTLGKRLGLDMTMDCNRVEVWVDGDYRGLYLLAEKIEADENRVNIDTNNGDFIIEMDWESRTEEGNIYFKTEEGRYYRLRDPEKEKQVDRIKATVDEFEAILKSGTWEQIKNFIDLDSFVAFYILNEFMKSIDFHQLSVYFYYHDGKFYGGPVWDYDNACGDFARTYKGHAIQSTEGLYLPLCHYYEFLWSFSEFRLAVSEKLSEVCSTHLFEEIYQTDTGWIDNDRLFYADAINRNNVYWNFTASYESSVSSLKTWLASRDVYMQEALRYVICEGYYYDYGEKSPAGLIEYEGKYYFAGDEGKILTGKIISGDMIYYADDNGVLLAQSFDVAISGNDSISLNYGDEIDSTYTVSVSKDYGLNAVKGAVSSEYTLMWDIAPKVEGIAINDGVLHVDSSAKIGVYNVTITATASSGDISGASTKNITVKVNNVAPVLTVNHDNITANKGKAIEAIIVTATSGQNITWTIDKALPVGLTYTTSDNTFTISGTPSAGTKGTYTYAITAMNEIASATQSITIDISGSANSQNVSGDIFISVEKDFTITSGEALLIPVSVDVTLKIYDKDYDEYYYSMDITGFPEWLRVSGDLTSSADIMSNDANFHHELTFTGMPSNSGMHTIILNAGIIISGDTPTFTANTSKDVIISVDVPVVIPPDVPATKSPDNAPVIDPVPEEIEPVIESENVVIVEPVSVDETPIPHETVTPVNSDEQQESEDVNDMTINEPEIIMPDITIDEPEINEPISEDTPQPQNSTGSKTSGTNIATVEDIQDMTSEQKQEITSLAITGQVTDLAAVIKELPNLEDLDLTEAEIEDVKLDETITVKSINLSGNTFVKTFTATNTNELASINFENCEALEYLDINHGKIASLNINGCVNLKTLDCSENGLLTLDLDPEKFPILNTVACAGQNNEALTLSRNMNFSDLLDIILTASALDATTTERVMNVIAFNASGDEIPVDYDNGTGAMKFSRAPAILIYDYDTGFNDKIMDVTISALSEDEQATGNLLGGSGSGCNSSYGLEIIALMIFMIPRSPSRK